MLMKEALGVTNNPKKFAHVMPFPSTSTSKDEPMQIDKTQFKPLMEQKKTTTMCEQTMHVLWKAMLDHYQLPQETTIHIIQIISTYMPIPKGLRNEDI